MKESEESDIFFSSSCSSCSSWFRFPNACENDKILRLLEQKDGPTPRTTIALTPCTLSLCGEHLCKTNPMPEAGHRGGVRRRRVGPGGESIVRHRLDARCRSGNKANPGGAGWLGPQGAGARRCKTNPISPRKVSGESLS